MNEELEVVLSNVLSVVVAGELSVDKEDQPLAVQPTITVSLEGDLSVKFEVC